MPRNLRSRCLPDGRTLEWTEVIRNRACATVEIWDEDGSIDGEPIEDDEFRHLLV